MTRRLPIATIALLLLAAGSERCLQNVQADSFELREGGIITGKLLSDPSSDVYKIQTNDGIVLEISSGKLKPRVVIPAEVQSIYKSMVGKEDTAELHRAVSLELNRDYKYLAKAHRERVVELDPSEENWKSLGEYYRDPKSGEWLPTELINKRKGLVKAGKGWDTPQSQAILKAAEKFDKANAEIKSRIQREWNNLNEKAPRGPAAIEFFRNLNDPLAIPHIEALIAKDPRRSELWMDILARMPGNSACGAFLRLSMNPTNSEVSNLALQMLNRTVESRELAFQYYLGMLEKIELRDRAANNMQDFADKRAIPKLIESLNSIRKTKKTDSTPNSISGNGDVSMGTSTTREISQLINHPSVHGLLVSLTNENFQYDQVKWKYWYAMTFAKSNLNLRRDE
jgi:hypothetical protein